MKEWMSEWMDGWMNERWMDGSMPGWMDGWMDTDPDVPSRTRFWTYVHRISTWIQWFEHHGCIKVAVQGIGAHKNGFLAAMLLESYVLLQSFEGARGAHGEDFSNMNENTAAILMLEAVNLQKWWESCTRFDHREGSIFLMRLWNRVLPLVLMRIPKREA